MSTDDNMRQQTLQTYSNSTCQWLRVSGGVCWRLLSSVFFSNLTLLRHQNIKMSIYKADKNHWVMWLFCFLVPVRKILKNTVALDHPVVLATAKQTFKKIDLSWLLVNCAAGFLIFDPSRDFQIQRLEISLTRFSKSPQHRLTTKSLKYRRGKSL